MYYLKKNYDSNDIFVKIGYYLILVFALTRPLSLVDLKVPFFLEIYSLGSSYLLTFVLLICVRKIKVDRTEFLILIFTTFCFLSFAWGSKTEDFIKLIIPFVFFFSAKTFFINEKKIGKFLVVYNLGFLFPLLISTLFIVLGYRIQMVEFWSEVPRHSGVYSGSHTLAYQMLFYSYFFAFFLLMYKNKNTEIKIITGAMFALSVYCLYQSHTRTAFIGFIIFWNIFLWGYSRKKFFYFLLILVIIAFFFSAQIINIFLKKPEELDFDRATSGRVGLWENYYDIFYESSLPEKLIGKGIGWKTSGPGFHNDYLKLLLNVGITGVLFYIFILISILYDIYLCTDIKIKYLFAAILISVSIMNFGSNSVISRIELSQTFWILCGFFYKFKNRVIA